MAMQQTGTILDISKFTTQCVNIEYIVGQWSSCPQQDNKVNKDQESYQINARVCGKHNAFSRKPGIKKCQSPFNIYHSFLLKIHVTQPRC